jgi:hypothetical protein
VPGIWTSLSSHRSIFWPIERVFCLGLLISRRPEITALLTALPRAAMLSLRVGITPTKAFVLHLTPPATSQGKKGRITAHPWLTARRRDSRRRGIAPATALLAGHRLGCHPVVGHGLPVPHGGGGFVLPRARLRGASRRWSLSLMGSIASHPEPSLIA